VEGEAGQAMVRKLDVQTAVSRKGWKKERHLKTRQHSALNTRWPSTTSGQQ